MAKTKKKVVLEMSFGKRVVLRQYSDFSIEFPQDNEAKSA